MAPGPEPALTLRPAEQEDLPALAEVFLAARAGAVPAMPPSVHPPEEVRRHYRAMRLGPGQREAWLAEDPAGTVVGFAELRGDWLDDLYVRPEHAGRGLGSALLDVVKAHRPRGFGLWVFVSNTPARAFYARHGLLELESTDGSANEERAPDVRVVWPGEEPLAFLRGLIDQVDVELGDLLARRLALTGAVQRVKSSGRRDPRREDDVARRVAARVPDLPAAAVARIVDLLISESLAAGRPDADLSVVRGTLREADGVG